MIAAEHREGLRLRLKCRCRKEPPVGRRATGDGSRAARKRVFTLRSKVLAQTSLIYYSPHTMTAFTNMFPSADQDDQILEYWINDLFRDPLLADVMETDAFRRLEDISFLGAINYAYPDLKLKKNQRSRARHSIHVAALTNYVSTARGYDPSLKRHLVLAGLLHDIGHLPLSHSAEPYFKASLGLGHHQLGEQILNGHNALGRELHSLLKETNDLDFLTDLISGTASDVDGGDLFSSPINIDTIDGIVRTHAVMASEPVNINRLAVAHAAFIDDDDSRYEVMDRFWKLKHFVYDRMINNTISLIADFSAKDFFEKGHRHLTESDLLDTESVWLDKYQELFQGFAKRNSFGGQRIDFLEREYLVDETEKGRHRYAVSKWKSYVDIDEVFESRTSEQLPLYFISQINS